MTVINAPASYGKLEGTVYSLGHCDANTATLEGVEVLIPGNLVAPTTDVSGTYAIWLDQGAYTVTVSYADHVTDTAVVTITAQTTTTHNVGLRWMQPCISVTPTGISATLDMGQSATLPMSIGNNGTAALEFELVEIAITPMQAPITLAAETASLVPGAHHDDQIGTSRAPAFYPQTVGDFTSKASSPVPLVNAAADPNTGYIYAQQVTGFGFYRYDPYSDSWAALSGCPLYSYHLSGATYLSGKIYTVYTVDSNPIGVYDIATDSWTTIRNNFGRGTNIITSDGQYIYLASDTTFRRYDPASGAWSDLASPDISFRHTSGGLSYLDGTIYGHNDASFARYDIASDTWATLRSIPYSAGPSSAIDPSGKI
jgi:hypothetical protein